MWYVVCVSACIYMCMEMLVCVLRNDVALCSVCRSVMEDVRVCVYRYVMRFFVFAHHIIWLII